MACKKKGTWGQGSAKHRKRRVLSSKAEAKKTRKRSKKGKFAVEYNVKLDVTPVKKKKRVW